MLGKRLNLARKEKGITAQKMADLLFVSLRTYQRYEEGGIAPTLEGLVKIADILHVSTDYLLCRDEFLAEQEEDRRRSADASVTGGEGAP